MFKRIIPFTVLIGALTHQVGIAKETLLDAPNFLDRLVSINSHSENIEGLKAVRNHLIPEFEKLGFTVQHHLLEKKHEVLSFDFPGEKPTLLLIGHVDTVFPVSAPIGNTGIEGDRIYGPGIIDMKGGIVVMLKALEGLAISERKKIRIVINDDEELASVYSRDTIARLASDIPFGLVFEPGLPDGSLVTSASGGRWIKVKVKGKAAHAGMEHAKGLNACAELGHKITEFNSLTNYSKKVTVNVGVIQGGTQPNVVCEEASTTLDVRYVNPTDLDQILGKIEAITKTPHIRNSTLSIEPTSSLETLAIVPSMPESSTEVLFSIAKEIAPKIKGSHVGYATDGNHLVKTGIKLLVGLGPFGGGMHTSQEFMLKHALEDRVMLNSRLIGAILGRAAQPSQETRLNKEEPGPTTKTQPVPTPENSSTVVLDSQRVSLGQSRMRIKSYSELMLPSLGNGNRFVPRSSGDTFVPAFLSSQIGIDYEVIPKYRFFYLQKGLLIYPSRPGLGTTQRFLDPRVGVRRTDVFATKGLTTDYDFFIQPGLTEAFIRQPSRSFDLGVRLAHRYTLPSSKWAVGANFEFVSTFFSANSAAADLSGVLAGFASYKISKYFATQHWLYAFYKHQRGDPLLKFSWDITEMPYIQNGISMNVSREVAFSLLVNQYAFVLPTLQNMWGSFWMTMNFS